jgi:hypothetical protein
VNQCYVIGKKPKMRREVKLNSKWADEKGDRADTADYFTSLFYGQWMECDRTIFRFEAQIKSSRSQIAGKSPRLLLMPGCEEKSAHARSGADRQRTGADSAEKI